MDINSLIERCSKTVASHCIEDGVYRRWNWMDDRGERSLGINEYGCADAANILYTIGELPGESVKREAFVKALQSLQNPESGLFEEATHHFIHTSAHCAAALELFDARPLYPFYALKQYSTVEGVLQLLESVDWVNDPWDASHQGAGIYAALVLNGEVDGKWQKAYFDWLYEQADEETGFWRKGAVQKEGKPFHHHMAGTFHYLFNHEYAKMPIHYPDKMIDSCMKMYRDLNEKGAIGRGLGFLEIDYVFCLNRATRQTAHRFDEAKEQLREFAEGYIRFLDGLDWEHNEGVNDLHRLFGVVCCLAELQSALPGYLRSDKPLKLVLDRRPFI